MAITINGEEIRGEGQVKYKLEYLDQLRGFVGLYVSEGIPCDGLYSRCERTLNSIEKELGIESSFKAGDIKVKVSIDTGDVQAVFDEWGQLVNDIKEKMAPPPNL